MVIVRNKYVSRQSGSRFWSVLQANLFLQLPVKSVVSPQKEKFISFRYLKKEKTALSCT